MRTTGIRSRPLLLRVAAVVAAAVALVACGGDDDPAGTDESEDASDSDEAVEVTLVDFDFEGLPASVPAGTQFTVVNESASELHELVAFRLPDDEDRSVAELADLPPDELVSAVGEPATVLLAEPGGGSTIPAVGDGTLTEPGRYAVMCFIPTGADPQEYLDAAAEAEEGPPEVEGGPPHFVHGMYDELTVE